MLLNASDYSPVTAGKGRRKSFASTLQSDTFFLEKRAKDFL